MVVRRILTADVLANVLREFAEVKPILRPLSSMTEDEGLDIFEDWNDDSPNSRDAVTHGYEPNELSPDQFVKLLSKGFDLFNLIPEGLALDSTLKPV